VSQPSFSPPPGVASVVADRLDAFIDAVGRWAAWCGLAMVLLIACNVILRYAFRIGPVWMQELEWHLMSPIALIGSAYAMRHNEHVRVELLYEKFGPKARAWVDLLAALTMLVMAVVIAKLSLVMVEQSFTSGETSTDPGGFPYRYLLKAFIPVGFILIALQSIAHAIRSGIKIRRGRGRG
jgi:TRAP-type mannitol/chloroaromatic compound transport system permease small subunit